jgi:hypothetical protein
VFRVILRIKSDFFPQQHQPVEFQDGQAFFDQPYGMNSLLQQLFTLSMHNMDFLYYLKELWLHSKG